MNQQEIEHLHRLTQLLQGIEVGLVVINQDHHVELWNGFMENHSGINAAKAKNISIFELFPTLPKDWLIRKIKAAFLLNSRTFTVWEQRPHVFPFAYSRPITGSGQQMHQNMTVHPLLDLHGRVSHVALIIYDVSVQATDRKQLISANRQLEQLSQVDPLTGLANRRQWEFAIEQEFQRCHRYQSVSTLLVVDIDHFKRVNDTHGHAGGDQVLTALGDLLAQSLRQSDVVARYGGEEFVVLLTGTVGEKAHIMAERLRLEIAALELNVPNPLTITVSIGLCAYHHKFTSAKNWFEAADAALYQAKQNGRNRVETVQNDPFVPAN